MKNTSDKISILDGGASRGNDGPGAQGTPHRDKFRKPLIYGLMGLIFLGCLYLIFRPSKDAGQRVPQGLNDLVPHATEDGLQPDKQKAYLEALLDEKKEEKKTGLGTLSDYWNTEAAATSTADGTLPHTDKAAENDAGAGGNGLQTYRKAQETLQGFYRHDDGQTDLLQKQVMELRAQLRNQQEAPKAFTVEDQLKLMEKSYEMAGKFLPAAAAPHSNTTAEAFPEKSSVAVPPKVFGTFGPAQSEFVSILDKSAYSADSKVYFPPQEDNVFFTAGTSSMEASFKNSVRACVHETQTVVEESHVKLRLLESASSPEFRLDAGTVLTAVGKLTNGRLTLTVRSIEHRGRVYPVELIVYDVDGQAGLPVPNGDATNALREIAANMGQTSGTSITMTRSAGQQVAGDLSRGLVQGVSTYFSRKARVQKVTLKAGHTVLLLSKK